MREKWGAEQQRSAVPPAANLPFWCGGDRSAVPDRRTKGHLGMSPAVLWERSWRPSPSTFSVGVSGAAPDPGMLQQYSALHGCPCQLCTDDSQSQVLSLCPSEASLCCMTAKAVSTERSPQQPTGQKGLHEILTHVAQK